MDIDFKWNKPVPQIVSDATGGAEGLKFLAVSWHRLYTPWIPMQSGNLADNVVYSVEGSAGVITHTARYAHRQYEGIGFRFSHEKHALATAQWDDAAKQAGKGATLAADFQNFLNRGGG